MNRLALWRIGATLLFSIAFIITSFMFTSAFIEIIGYLKIVNYTHSSTIPILLSTLVGLIGAPLIWNKL